MKKYKLKDFARWAQRARISDKCLVELIDEMARGLLGDRLGGSIYKKRIRVEGRGKRGGGRVIVLYKDRDVCLFLFGYLKNEKSDLSQSEERQLRIFGGAFSNLTQLEREKLVLANKLVLIEE